ncbi:hypothetical protein [Hufsiella ginkgonis]|uniref:Uncharacterized protein n=1 Tax=Hufsiella ginkgonis TaxID=2695274 RepID=A0A7K1Y3A3_9SPHI|nr:hypothetical protein [Hufsiella ginkgonis]MXV17722.1 hypothetical protein [Hufsiella ginkgonis]
MKIQILKFLTISFIVALPITVIGIYLVAFIRGEIDLQMVPVVFSSAVTTIGILFGSLTYFNNRESSERAQIEKYYSVLTSDINDAIYDGKRGVEAYFAFNIKTGFDNNVLDNLNLVITSFEIYEGLIKENGIIGGKFKSINLKRLYLLYYSKVLWPLHSFVEAHGKAFIEREHDDSRITLDSSFFEILSHIRDLQDFHFLRNREPRSL